MKSVVLQFAAERTLGSALIRWFCHSRYSHVDFVLHGGRLLGARFAGGVQIRPAKYAKFSRVLRVRIETDQAEAIYRWVKCQVGAPYDWRAILAFVVPASAKHRNWRDPGAWFCSELGAAAFEANGFPILNPKAPVTKIAPGDLLLSPDLKEMSCHS